MAVITPDTFNPLRRYVAVRLQQGVPIVDADENEREDVRRFELRAFLKWFVGDGVPEGVPNAFRIDPPAAAAPDFIVRAGFSGVPDGLSNVGRCLVDGQDILITTDFTFISQPLHASQPGSAALSLAWGVPVIAALAAPAANLVATAYVDTWLRLVTTAEDPSQVHVGLGTESCVRLRREFVIRVRDLPVAPAPGDADFLPGHSYYALAALTRRAGDANVVPADVADRREQRLLVPPASLIEDLLGISPLQYRRGQGRPPVSLREAINALLRGELPSSPDIAIAPDPANDFMSFAFPIMPDGSMVAVWHSDRVAGVNQVFASRWTAATGFATPPQQVTTTVAFNRLPHAIALPPGDLVVTYENAAQDIQFKRGPLLALNAAVEQPVAATAVVSERHPFAVLTGSLVVFFWQQGPPTQRWMFRRRQYDPSWTEAAAAWVDATGQQLSPTVPTAPSLSVGEFHAAVDAAGDTWVAFRTALNQIQALRFTPGGGLADQQILSTGGLDQEPFVLVDGTFAVWVFWRSAVGVHAQRFIRSTNLWEAAPALIPDTGVGGLNQRPCAVRTADGAIWLFWASDRASPGTNDIWLVRRNPVTSGWGQARQITGAPLEDNQPFGQVAPNGLVWLFWRSNRSGNFDLFFKQLVTAV